MNVNQQKKYFFVLNNMYVNHRNLKILFRTKKYYLVVYNTYVNKRTLKILFRTLEFSSYCYTLNLYPSLDKNA